MKSSVLYYGAAYLPILRAMRREKLLELLNQINEITGEVPLHLPLCAGESRQLSFAAWRNGEMLSGPQTLALMVFGLWVSMGEREENVSSLCEAWPVKEVVLLVDEKLL